jgi:putative FmdB family regulatory protein
MPTYDYFCTNCNTSFEVVCKISERTNEHVCPKCNSSITEQRIFLAPKRVESHRIGTNAKQRDFRKVLSNIHSRTPGSLLDKTTNI